VRGLQATSGKRPMNILRFGIGSEILRLQGLQCNDTTWTSGDDPLRELVCPDGYELVIRVKDGVVGVSRRKYEV